jgi:FKBP-type peptidyl-prolyl cis-trans isomerase (trigger factor)
MTKHAIHRRPDGTIELTITVLWKDVSSVYDHIIDHAVEHAELPGFRKGKAPKKLVEEKLDTSKVYEDVIRELLPTIYNEVVTEEKLKPIISPKVELKEAKEDSDWQIVIYTCEKPAVTLGDYKKAVNEGKTARHKKIWVPGQEKEEKDKKEDKGPTLDEILLWVLDTISINIPDMLLEQEVNRLLSALIDQTKTLGLTVEQYLASTGKNSESIRKEYEEQARRTITLEFGLEEIADKEKILVEDDDIDKVINSAKTEEEKQSLKDQRYYIASVLRRQKTLDALAVM